EVILRLVNDQRSVTPGQEDGQQRGAFLPPRQLGRVLEVRLTAGRDIKFDAHAVLDGKDLQRQRVEVLPQGIEDLTSALFPERSVGLQLREVVLGENLGKLLRTNAYQGAEDLLLVLQLRAVQRTK